MTHCRSCRVAWTYAVYQTVGAMSFETTRKMKTLLCGVLLCAATFGQDISGPEPRTTIVSLSLDQSHRAFTAEQGNNLLFNTPTGALAFFFPAPGLQGRDARTDHECD